MEMALRALGTHRVWNRRQPLTHYSNDSEAMPDPPLTHHGRHRLAGPFVVIPVLEIKLPFGIIPFGSGRGLVVKPVLVLRNVGRLDRISSRCLHRGSGMDLRDTDHAVMAVDPVTLPVPLGIGEVDFPAMKAIEPDCPFDNRIALGIIPAGSLGDGDGTFP